MHFLKLFLFKQQHKIWLISYKAFSMQSVVGEAKFEEYVAEHFKSFAEPFLALGWLKEFPSELCVVEISGEVKNMQKFKIENPAISINNLQDLTEKQLSLVGFPPIVHRLLLEEIGITDFWQNWCRFDDRQPEWQQQQEKYGFDERSAWNTDVEIKRIIYEKIVFFQRHAPREERATVVFKHKTFKLEQYLSDIVEGLKLDLTLPLSSPLRKEKVTKAKIQNALPMVLNCLGQLWW